MELLRSKAKVEVVTDQVGTPTYTGDVAQFVLELFEKKAAPGIYHFANGEYASWYDFALEIQKQTGLKECKVVPARTENIHRPAQRPLNSQFDLSKAVGVLGHPIRPWAEALGEYLTKEIS
jgi:dTDP-4-dehydrorhamnose reductase